MHSKEHIRKKAEALAEARSHLHSSVMQPRDGKDHEDHKMKDMIMDEAESMRGMQ